MCVILQKSSINQPDRVYCEIVHRVHEKITSQEVKCMGGALQVSWLKQQ